MRQGIAVYLYDGRAMCELKLDPDPTAKSQKDATERAQVDVVDAGALEHGRVLRADVRRTEQ